MLNPILYTEKVIGDFLKYQLTAYPFADNNLYSQMRSLLNLEETRRTPLFKGPYISLSRSFRQGATITDLIAENIFHPHLKQLIPYPNLYGHQEQAIRNITQGKTTLVSTGTGSGKTECFIYPIVSHCLHLRDNNTSEGIAAIIVYPMNALAEDQLGRLREFLAGTGVSFGMYVGKTPERAADVTGIRLKAGASQLDYQKAVEKAQRDKQPTTIYPPEERASREELRKNPPRILLTNIKQLELLLTRQTDIELFNNVRLKFLVFDEAHTFSGATGAETACLIRRLRSFCHKNTDETTFIATSATIADPNLGQEAGRDFAARFFGIARETVELVGEQYQQDLWADRKTLPAPLTGDTNVHLKNVLDAIEQAQDREGTLIKAIFQAMSGQIIDAQNWQENLYDRLAANELVYQLDRALKTPRLLSELIADLKQRIGQNISESDFELPRPPAMALREYVPGNLIYANGNRFVPRFYHLEPQQQTTLFQIDLAHEAVAEVGSQTNSSLSVAGLRAVPICDVDLPHQSHITDEESYRFQLPVSIMGYELNRHNGGKQYHWCNKTFQLRRGVHLRLVNIGVASLVNNGTLGYRVCLVCGQSRSPLSSSLELDQFAQDHRERCGQPVDSTGFYTDVVADALSIQDCTSREEAYSLAEALRFGASRVLDMEIEDLQILTIGQAGRETVDVLLYDPMPGGSGLLDQLVDRWQDITSQALEVVMGCPSSCETACIDCLFTYRNSYYHRYLNRHLAVEKLNQWGDELTFSHEIPSKLPQAASKEEQPVNDAEIILRDMLLRAGFPTPTIQYPINLGQPLGTTTPDFFYEDPDEASEGVCIYLDGMSQNLHGNPDRQQRDRAIRDELENLGYEVFTIPASNLSDRNAMTKYFFRIGRILLGKQKAKQLREQADWFELSD